MKLSDLTGSGGGWLDPGESDNRIVITSRIRLARNLRDEPFPGWAKKAERIRILERVQPAVQDLTEMRDGCAEGLGELSALDKQVLVERHLISREHAAKGAGSAVVVNRRQTVSIMINEEDHLRMQALRPGLQLAAAWKQIDKVDTGLENRLDYAFHSRLGYLTACPSNVGTGMRASVMAHLPGLVLNEQINQVIQAVTKIGLAVRGLYGEGTEAMGNLFQVSNQTTLGETEQEILDRLGKVIGMILQHERNARENLQARRSGALLDQIGRAYGILTHAWSITSKEALNLLSLVRLGIDLGLFPETARRPVDGLFMETQPAHLQKSSRQKLAAEERDALRAASIRARLKALPAPATGLLESGNGSDEEKAHE